MIRSAAVASRPPAFLVVLLVLGTAAPALAQAEATIRGQVIAAANGAALTGVTVTLEPRPEGEPVRTVTDSAGRFAFQNVSAGEYAISTAPDGFAPEALRLALEPREIGTVTFALDVRPLAVNVEVAAEAASIASTHSPSSTVLTPERLERMPPSQRTNLPEAIVTLAPGMIRGHDDFVHVRGHEIALNPLIEGVSFWENPHALFSAGLSPYVIDTANVMTGGFSAEYGNRFGGVVDVVTKSGRRMQNSGSASFSIGEAGRRNAEGEFGGVRDRFSYYAFGSGFGSDRFLSPPAPAAIHDSAQGGHGFGRLDTNLGDAGALRLIVMGSGTNFEIPKTPQDVELRPLADAEQRTRQQTAILGWTRAFSGLAAARRSTSDGRARSSSRRPAR
jgi:hypothetical protein